MKNNHYIISLHMQTIHILVLIEKMSFLFQLFVQSQIVIKLRKVIINHNVS